MRTLREIRKKLSSVHNIKQITKAMEMVAAARLRKAQAKVEHSKPYIIHLKDILDNLAYGDEDRHPLFAEREPKKIGVVIIAGDKGLCGSYNSTVFAAADKFLEENRDKNPQIIAVGRKTASYYENKKWPIKQKVIDWGGKIAFKSVQNLAGRLSDMFTNKELDEIYIIYTQFISIIKRQVLIEKYLNLGKPKDTKTSPISYIFEPGVRKIYQELLPRYLMAKIQTSLDEAYASELAARLMAMRAANKNADELIISLTLTRNKVRQSSITKEMLEITAGSLNV